MKAPRMSVVEEPTGVDTRVDWDSVAAFAKDNAGHWVSIEDVVGAWTKSAVVGGRIQAFAEPEGGHWQSDMRDTHRKGGTYYGSLFIRWVPES